MPGAGTGEPASETSLTRSQILSQAAQSVLSQANASPQAALALPFERFDIACEAANIALTML